MIQRRLDLTERRSEGRRSSYQSCGKGAGRILDENFTKKESLEYLNRKEAPGRVEHTFPSQERTACKRRGNLIKVQRKDSVKKKQRQRQGKANAAQGVGQHRPRKQI